ncbi:NADPH-dependent FMN reductase [Jiella avicenniae]|uniref:NAD(P)H-dependent oxidoreductase n=1 Tax=Jiella avicenniae TaxID=2907202 RepID=A0A9X1T6K2_9HYPH|nr:NAD(P)H-dependent oxidoreductase [Jiella avicenniae]MCE7029425.1 NAD(P)H-dependent oxidoreductase [Jiella avicenniae]
MPKLKIAVIISSTRDTRFGPIPAEWMVNLASRRDDLDVELVDLKSFDLPFFNERMSNLGAPSEDPRAVAWQKKIGEFDGYIVVTAEYNRSLTAAMKNAFDQAYVEWNRKPIGFLGYGAVGASHAIDHARTIAIELHMVPVRSAIHIGGSEYVKVVHQRQPIAEIEPAIMRSATELLDQIAWWGRVTRAGRDAA